MKIPIFIKLTPNITEVVEIAKAAQEGIVSANLLIRESSSVRGGSWLGSFFPELKIFALTIIPSMELKTLIVLCLMRTNTFICICGDSVLFPASIGHILE